MKKNGAPDEIKVKLMKKNVAADEKSSAPYKKMVHMMKKLSN